MESDLKYIETGFNLFKSVSTFSLIEALKILFFAFLLCINFIKMYNCNFGGKKAGKMTTFGPEKLWIKVPFWS